MWNLIKKIFLPRGGVWGLFKKVLKIKGDNKNVRRK